MSAKPAPQLHVQNDLVSDLIMDALDNDNRVLKIKADLGDTTSNGFLLKHDNQIKIFTRSQDGGFDYFTGAQLEGRLSNAGELSKEEGFRVKQILDQMKVDSVNHDSPLKALQEQIRSSYDALSHHAYMPPLFDDAVASSSEDLKSSNRFSQTVERWYEDLGIKLSDVARRIALQSEDLPQMKDIMLSALKGFDKFDVQEEAKLQYHRQQPTLLAAMESQIDTNQVLIKHGALIKLGFDELSQRMTMTMYNQSMQPVASAISQSMPLTEVESTAPEDLEDMFGQGSRVVSKIAMFEDARWQPHDNNQVDITPILEVLSESDLGRSGMMVDAVLIDMDNEQVPVEQYDIYADIMEESAKSLSASGDTIIPGNQLSKAENTRLMTSWLAERVDEAMLDVTSQMSSAKNNDSFGDFDYH